MGLNRPGRRSSIFDIESFFFWSGLRSCIFHITAESAESKRILGTKSLLNHPGICCHVEELSCEDAADVMDGVFRKMQKDAFNLRIGNKTAHRALAGYKSDTAELNDSVTNAGAKIFRVKVLFDADKIDRRTANEILGRLHDLRF